MKPIQITQVGAEMLPTYGRVPIAFGAESIFEVVPVNGGLGGFQLVEKLVDPPLYKNYDEFEPPEEWPAKFDVAHWAFFLAYAGELAVGAATLVHASPEIHLLDGRSDLGLLWDIRVAPDFRGQGVGRALFQHAAEAARDLGLAQMKIETQNINVAANRFYRAMGCTLGAIHRYFYAGKPAVQNEVALFWYLDLD